jgi:hypothetical protein
MMNATAAMFLNQILYLLSLLDSCHQGVKVSISPFRFMLSKISIFLCIIHYTYCIIIIIMNASDIVAKEVETGNN